jgi:periplasmic copper chaperone A
MSMSRALSRSLFVGALAAALLSVAGPALAHITITPDSVRAGSTAVLTLHVPNEQAHANTIKVDVQIPTSHPIAQLLVEPVPGWSISVRTITLSKPITTDDGTFSQAVSEVIWSGGRIRPGQFQDFTISADPMPTGLSKLVLKSLQTYSNGDVVRWIDLPQPGQPAPDHPAPTITLTTGALATGPASARTAGAGSAPAGSSTDDLTRVLAVASLLVGLLAILLVLMTGRRSRRPAVPAIAPAAQPGAPPPPRTNAKTKASAQRSASRRRG